MTMVVVVVVVLGSRGMWSQCCVSLCHASPEFSVSARRSVREHGVRGAARRGG